MTVAPKRLSVLKPLYSIVEPTIENVEVEARQLSLFSIEGSIVEPTIEPEDRPKVHNGCINEYSKGTNWYHRYTYKVGKKYKHKHIGPLGDSLATWKAQRAREKILLGESISDILTFLS
jgi:hypothetical protein